MNNLYYYSIMEWFYFVVIVVALLLLIIMLTYVGTRMISMGKSGNIDSVFPPVKNTCPDLWEPTVSGNITYCKVPSSIGNNRGSLYSAVASSGLDADKINSTNTPGLSGTGTETKINFANDGWSSTGGSGDCAKQNWANSRGILWDGISNYNQC
jgi:hypothetical protein